MILQVSAVVHKGVVVVGESAENGARYKKFPTTCPGLRYESQLEVTSPEVGWVSECRTAPTRFKSHTDLKGQRQITFSTS